MDLKKICVGLIALSFVLTGFASCANKNETVDNTSSEIVSDSTASVVSVYEEKEGKTSSIALTDGNFDYKIGILSGYRLQKLAPSNEGVVIADIIMLDNDSMLDKNVMSVSDDPTFSPYSMLDAIPSSLFGNKLASYQKDVTKEFPLGDDVTVKKAAITISGETIETYAIQKGEKSIHVYISYADESVHADFLEMLRSIQVNW